MIWKVPFKFQSGEREIVINDIKDGTDNVVMEILMVKIKRGKLLGFIALQFTCDVLLANIL